MGQSGSGGTWLYCCGLALRVLMSTFQMMKPVEPRSRTHQHPRKYQIETQGHPLSHLVELASKVAGRTRPLDDLAVRWSGETSGSPSELRT